MGDWEVACIPKDCQGINHDTCDAHSGKCQWDWVKDWKVSCIRKDCQASTGRTASCTPKSASTTCRSRTGRRGASQSEGTWASDRGCGALADSTVQRDGPDLMS